MTIKKIGPFSAAKISAVLYTIMGFIMGIFFALFGFIGALASSGMNDEAGIVGVFFGVGAIIIMPILYGAFGFVGGLIGAWLYNVVAGWIGGLEIEFENPPATPPPGQGY